MGCRSSKHESPAPQPGAVKLEPQAATPVATAATAEQVASAFAFDSFLSHDWGTDAGGRSNHARVVAIGRRLTEECGLRCWLDEEKMGGDVNKAMTEGIDGSATVLVFITERYLMKAAGNGPNGTDDNCKMEFDYACLRKGTSKMIAVVMEQGMRSTKGWAGVVGAKLGTSLYVDLSADESDAAFASGLHQLAKEVRKRAGTGASCDSAQRAESSQQQPAATPASAAQAAPAATPASAAEATPAAQAAPAAQASPAADQSAASRRNSLSQLAEIPEEVPEPPEGVLERSELISALKQRVLPPAAGAGLTKSSTISKLLRKESSGKIARRGNATVAVGMGGVGKSVSASLFVRNPAIRTAFDKICWVSVGQEPDTAALQQLLHLQLTACPLPEAATANKRAALTQLRQAAKPLAVLLVLDDVWDRAHVLHLNLIDPASSRSALLVTTRIRGLIDGAAEVACELLSDRAALQLLLRTGGYEELLDSPPPASLEAVDLCGRLPLALGIAGGIIAELADSWERELIPMLKESEFDDQMVAVEERVVTASLRSVPAMIREGVQGLFALLGLFAEDVSVPAVAVDALAPRLIPGGDAVRQSAQKRLQLRRWLQQLLKANIVRGSIEAGVAVHDLVRDCMIRRAEASREGGVRALQREAVPLLLATYDADEPAAPYVADNLQWHVRQSRQPSVPIETDTVIMTVLTHESPAIRKQGAVGLGLDVLQAAAEECDTRGEHLRAAELMYAASAVRGSAAGAEAQRAWTSLQKLEKVGKGSDASRALETRVGQALTIATEGGFAFGSKEHSAMLERMRELCSSSTTSDRAEASGAEVTAPARSKEAMESAFGLALAEAMAALSCDGVSGYPGKQTHELVVQSYGHWQAFAAGAATAATTAPDDVLAEVMRVWEHAVGMFLNARQHALPDFVPVTYFGAGGKLLRERHERYDFDKMHAVAKGVGIRVDGFMYGTAPLGLLLFFGDLAGARAGFAKLFDAHKRMLARVQQERTATAEEYAFEVILEAVLLPASMLAAGDTATLRELMAHSLLGKVLEDEAIRAGIASFWKGAFGAWRSDDGHCYSSQETFLMVVRALFALTEEGEAATASLAWLPAAAELLRIAEYEGVWRAHSVGANHPSLLCARLHGERLGKWDVTAEVAEGVLQVEEFQPLLRTEACRLLGRARAKLGQRKAACEAAEAAEAEAAKAKYVWLELLSLRDLLRWCEEGEAESVRARLSSVAGRMVATPAELTGVLGEGVLK